METSRPSSPNPVSTAAAASVLTMLKQLHAAERAQQSELRVLRDKCSVPAITALLDRHLAETGEHGDLLEARLAELGTGPSVWNLIETFGSTMAKGVVERLRPLATGDILREAITAEAAEVADYLVLELEALRAGDASTAVVAREIRHEERLTLDELRGFWNQAAHRDFDGASNAVLIHQLQLAHSVEQVAAGSLVTAGPIIDNRSARSRIEDHRAQTLRQSRDIAVRIHELGASMSLLPVIGTIASSLAAAPLHVLRTPRPEQVVRDMYVVEHLEIATYEQMMATAELLGDDRTYAMAERHLDEELAMAEWIERYADAFVS